VTLQGKRILVVGGSSGIGYAVARAALQNDATVVVASSSPEKIAAAAGTLGHGALAEQLDVTSEREVNSFFARVGRFDHIVFTAGDWGGGGLRRGPLAGVDLREAADLFKVRFWGALAVAKHGANTLPPGGSITLTNGTIAHRPQIGTAITTAMTGAIEHLTRALAVELAPIRVNAVCPGLIRTAIWDRIPADRREAELKAMTSRLLVPRPGEPDEVAEAYLYLMKGTYTTGQVLLVEGGRLLAG